MRLDRWILTGVSCALLAACTGAPLTLSVDRIEFGTVPLGTTLSERITVSNPGSEDVELSEVRLVSEVDDFSLLVIEGALGALPPDGTIELQIDYRANTLGPIEAELHLVDDVGGSVQRPGPYGLSVGRYQAVSRILPIRAEGDATARLCADPGSLDFGRQDVLSERIVSVENCGAVTVEGIATGLSGDASFGIGADTLAGSALAVGESGDVVISFDPTGVAAASGTLLVSSTTGAEVSVSLSGAGPDAPDSELICDDGVDNDGDGAIDCDDTDCAGDPACDGAVEDCGDGVDNDGDGLVDCADDDCVCGDEDCFDGVDNDGDGLVDCDDEDCPCDGEFDCYDGFDNDGDGRIDCEDDECPCLPETECRDGFDNDEDGLLDCADPDCEGVEGCFEVCDDGVDNDADFATDCQDTECEDLPNCREDLNCADDIDNDVDGLIDCADEECVTDPNCREDTNCTDGIDNDWDGLVDCDDTEDCGLLGPEVSDFFTWDGLLPIDILFVIDNSGSMSEEQTTLAANITLFFAELAGLDYQVGVVTTDDPVLRTDGGVALITPSTPDALSAMQVNAVVGTEGSPDEQPLAMAVAATAPALTAPGGVNDGLVRDDARLEVAIVTDEDDDSPGPVSGYLTSLQALKPSPGLVSVSAVGGGSRIDEAVSSTSGVQGPLTGSWGGTLSGIAAGVSERAGSLFLDQPAEPSTVRVFVNGIEQFSGWIFRAGGGIEFLPGSEPPAGASIEVQYTVLQCF